MLMTSVRLWLLGNAWGDPEVLPKLLPTLMALLYKMTKSLKMHHHLVHLLTKIGCRVSSILFCAGPVPGCDICKLLELCIFHNNSLSRCTLCRATRQICKLSASLLFLHSTLMTYLKDPLVVSFSLTLSFILGSTPNQLKGSAALFMHHNGFHHKDCFEPCISVSTVGIFALFASFGTIMYVSVWNHMLW